MHSMQVLECVLLQGPPAARTLNSGLEAADLPQVMHAVRLYRLCHSVHEHGG